MKKSAVILFLSFLCAASFGYSGNATGASQNKRPAWITQQNGAEKVYDFSTILVKFKEGTTKRQRKDIASLAKGKFKDKNEDGIDDRYQNILGGRLAALELQGEKGVDLASRALRALKHHPFIEYAEYNYLRYIDNAPSDPRFGELWGLNNTGQTGGTPDADIDAPEAWETYTGSTEIVVGVIDTGIDYDHEDLAANIWGNPGEIPGNGVDDDGNGYVDDIHGINAITGSGDPNDDHGHGTHCAGTIGAVGNNGKGVVGVNWKVRLVGMKFLDLFGYGSTVDAIECINYAIALKNNGVNIRVLSNSWGGGGYSQGLYDAIDATNNAGILFVAAAGNDGLDTDSNPHYPSSYDNVNILAVASTDSEDKLSSFSNGASNYGSTSVDIGAPGSSILSTTPNNTYSTKSGTSMATPHVSGAAALLLSVNDELAVGDLKDYLMDYGDTISALAGKCVSGKRLNVFASLGQVPPPEPTFRLSANPASQAINQGQTASYNIDIESVLAFSGEVHLTANSNPSINDAITFTPSSGIPSYTSTMTVATTTDTDPGDYIITVTGVSGSISRTTTIALEVKPKTLTTVSYTNNEQIPIPDNDSSGITSDIYVPESLSVWDTTCEVHITHSWIGDMIITLTSPAGTESILQEREGGSADFPEDGKTYFPTEFRDEPVQGTWTLFVSDNGWSDVGTLDSWTLTIEGVPTGPANQAPTVTITAPADGSSSDEGTKVTFTGTALDPEEGDISAGIEWHSSIDGNLGIGAPYTTSTLSVDTHVITATAKDSGGNSGSDSITITITVNESVCNGDGTCEAGEDCNNCPSDCISGQVEQTCDACFKGECDGKCNPSKEGPYCEDCAQSYCCGDGICEAGEDYTNCSVDCLAPSCGDGICDDSELCSCAADCEQPSTEIDCSDGVDNDCDGFTDGADSDCQTTCFGKNDSCSEDGDCCSGDCKPNGRCR
jgi:subtilisin family serine protease